MTRSNGAATEVEEILPPPPTPEEQAQEDGYYQREADLFARASDRWETRSREQLDKVSARFPATQVKKNPKGFDYIDIPSVIARLNEVFGLGWSSKVTFTECQVLNPDTHGIGVNRRNGGAVAGFHYNVVIEITAGGSTRAGVGSDFDTDPDKAYKTAYAEAVKKAGHQFGIALYLWDADERTNVAEGQRAAKGDRKSLKNQLVALAKQRGVEGSPEAIADHFGVALEDLQDIKVLQDILTEHGVI